MSKLTRASRAVLGRAAILGGGYGAWGLGPVLRPLPRGRHAHRPMGLSVFGAPPLANFLSHALIRIDTDSRVLARALRRAGLRTGFRPRARFRRSPRGVVPASGRFAIPGRYGVRVRATEPDPTNPHDHTNVFDYRGRSGSLATLGLSAADAFDRFCFPSQGGCRASLRAPRRSPMARLLGGTSATARVGFDHARLGRVDLSTVSSLSGP